MNSDRDATPMTRHMKRLQGMLSGEAPPPIARLIGFTATHFEPGGSVMELVADERHANPMGTLHGGVICDLADAAMGTAMATTLADDETFTTLDISARYFKPVWRATLRAEGRVVRRTKTLGYVECDVTDETGSLVAKVSSTCIVLRGEEARGR
ncbi:PaaI family thioesterase [bacterium]|nr:PaaI family thioesterase [bacterium]